MNKQVLLVDAEPNIRDPLPFNLSREGYGVSEARTADEALRSFRGAKPDIILLDVMLPGMSGFEVCRIVRQESTVPIIMLTAKDQELDKVLGLGVGADDYITKPFGLQELFARMTAVLRRSEGRQQSIAQLPEVERLGPMVIDRAARRVTLDGVEVKLTGREFDLLSFFLGHAGPPPPTGLALQLRRRRQDRGRSCAMAAAEVRRAGSFRDRHGSWRRLPGRPRRRRADHGVMRV